ncbi:MAG: MFS transporter [Actinomycetota bacterium]
MEKTPGQDSLGERLTSSQRIRILAAIAVGSFMAPLDSSMVNIALPRISSYFGTGLGQVEWVLISYLLVISSLLLVLGRLGDLLGHKKVYNAGFIVFISGSLLCAFSPSLLMLIIFRTIQAAGAAMLMAMGPAIITICSPSESRGRYLGLMAAAVYIALSAGPLLGGFLTTFFGWRSIFIVNIPIAAAGFTYSRIILPKTRGSSRAKFDLLGSILFFLSLATILSALSLGRRYGFFSAVIVLPFFSGLILLAVFIRLQKRRKHPMMDIGLFSNRLFSSCNSALFLYYAAQYAFLLIMPFYLQDLLGLIPSTSGLVLMSFPLTVMAVSPFSGAISDKIGARYLTATGMSIACLGLFLLSTLDAASSIFKTALFLSITGLGSGMFITPNNSTIMGTVDFHRRGTASAMISTMRNIGMVTGVSLAGSIFTIRYQALLKAYQELGIEGTQPAFEGALSLSLLTAAALAFASAAISLTGKKADIRRSY